MIRTQSPEQYFANGDHILTEDIVSPSKGDTPQQNIHELTLLLTITTESHTQCPSAWAISKWRRYLDFVVALVMIIFSLPLIICLSVCVYVSSPGPILFRQRRIGRRGEEFTLYKFRSMRIGGRPGSAITTKNDPRITPVGSFMRRLKLDELPQFVNILKGDMSLVGPRPKLPSHEALFMLVRPGITGPATLAFRREEELLSAVPLREIEEFYEIFIKPLKAKMDSSYIRKATLRSDVALCWATMVSCLGLSKKYSLIGTDGELRSCHCRVGVEAEHRAD